MVTHVYSLWRWRKRFPQDKLGIGPPRVCTRVRAYPHLCAPTNAKTRVLTYTNAYHKHIRAQRKCTEDHMVSVIFSHDSDFLWVVRGIHVRVFGACVYTCMQRQTNNLTCHPWELCPPLLRHDLWIACHSPARLE